MSPFIAPTSVSSLRSRFGGEGGCVRFLGVFLILLFCVLLLILRDFALVLAPLLAIILRVRERLAIAGDVAHARHRRARLAAVDAFRIFAAGHLQALRRVRKLHCLIGRRGHVLERDCAPADEIGGAGQDLQRGDAAFERCLEAGILRPHAVLRPHVRRDRIGHFVAVAVRVDARSRIDAEMRVHVDEPGRDPAALCIDHARAGRRTEIRSDGFDLAVRDQHIRAIEPRAGAREHGRAANQRRRCRAGAVRGRIRVDGLGRDGRGFGFFLFSVLLRRARACTGKDGAADAGSGFRAFVAVSFAFHGRARNLARPQRWSPKRTPSCSSSQRLRSSPPP